MGNPVELGVKVRSDNPGYLTAIRFYKAPNESGSSHVVSLWSVTGTLLGSATSSGETASGWQQANLAVPVAISVNTTYVVSYHSNGRFGRDLNAFASGGVDNVPLHALANGADGPNGVYIYGASSAFPTNSYQSTNYYVDVVFNSTAQIPTATPTLTPTPTFTPGPPTNTPTPTSTPTATNTPVPTTCPCTIWPASATPAVPAQTDSNSVEVGVKFRADRDGRITALRFYKGTTNTGSHQASLWSGTGTLLAQVVFMGETASGWQQVTLPTPVAVTAGTTYVASYHATVGRYSVNQGYFLSSGLTNGPLTALQTGTDGGNGVYAYSSVSVFPTNTYNGSNYWVDVVFVSP